MGCLLAKRGSTSPYIPFDLLSTSVATRQSLSKLSFTLAAPSVLVRLSSFRPCGVSRGYCFLYEMVERVMKMGIDVRCKREEVRGKK